MIEVSHSRGTYQIRFDSVVSAIQSDAALVDEHVFKLWGSRLELTCPVYVVPAGETSKSINEFGRIQEFLAAVPVRRSGQIAVIGGGVTGDLGGFVASTYMRGIRYLQIPTTLLAMVDSSVGGKVAVDLDAGKNLVGSFYPPESVVIATEFLSTLPARQVKNGMAEAWKTAFIMDESLLPLCEKPGDYQDLVSRCVTHKRTVVMEDEFEVTGRRAILNFGHTIGHAIEAATGYESLLHGEAVAIGMSLEALLGERMGVTQEGTAEFVTEKLQLAGFELDNPCKGRTEHLIELMKRDKKATRAGLSFAFLERIGACKLVHDVPETLVREVME
ncbi:MAG TPA: 3-dehydroquinate synthase [Fimbriimonadaceae bacterium]|mgnify:CR=1 FL=1|nr:3-dehydroquinate synthase [Fimbriimonadaceae bacterium]